MAQLTDIVPSVYPHPLLCAAWDWLQLPHDPEQDKHLEDGWMYQYLYNTLNIQSTIR